MNPDKVVTLDNGYKIVGVKLDGEPAVKLKCPQCDQWGFLDNEQLNGNKPIICSVCEYHHVADIFSLLTQTKAKNDSPGI